MARRKIYYKYEVPTTVVNIVKEVCADYTRRRKAIRDNLAELEDKIEDGTITELPCKVGDTIFTCSFVCADGYEILENGTENMIHDCGWKVIPTFIKDKIGLFKACIAVEKGLAYATNAEAEAKLKELEVQNNG